MEKIPLWQIIEIEKEKERSRENLIPLRIQLPIPPKIKKEEIEEKPNRGVIIIEMNGFNDKFEKMYI